MDRGEGVEREKDGGVREDGLPRPAPQGGAGQGHHREPPPLRCWGRRRSGGWEVGRWGGGREEEGSYYSRGLLCPPLGEEGGVEVEGRGVSVVHHLPQPLHLPQLLPCPNLGPPGGEGGDGRHGPLNKHQLAPKIWIAGNSEGAFTFKNIPYNL